MFLKELIQFLNQILPSNGVIDYCPNGLQIEGKEKISKIATAVSGSINTIEKAVLEGVDALIVHHGIFWQKDSYVIQGTKKRKIEQLIKHGISLIAYHLPLDLNQQFGNNWKAAKDMEWVDLEPFGYFDKVPIGVKGRVKPTPRETFKRQLETYYQHPASYAFGGPEMIQTAALISGGAYKSIIEAAENQIDAFITGNFDEPAWHHAMEEKINFYALGHSATERVGPLALANYLQSQLKIPCSFIDVENPF